MLLRQMAAFSAKRKPGGDVGSFRFAPKAVIRAVENPDYRVRPSAWFRSCANASNKRGRFANALSFSAKPISVR